LSVVNSGRRLLPLGLLPLSAMLVTEHGYFAGHGMLLVGLAPLAVVATLWLRLSGNPAAGVGRN